MDAERKAAVAVVWLHGCSALCGLVLATLGDFTKVFSFTLQQCLGQSYLQGLHVGRGASAELHKECTPITELPPQAFPRWSRTMLLRKPAGILCPRRTGLDFPCGKQAPRGTPFGVAFSIRPSCLLCLPLWLSIVSMPSDAPLRQYRGSQLLGTVCSWIDISPRPSNQGPLHMNYGTVL